MMEISKNKVDTVAESKMRSHWLAKEQESLSRAITNAVEYSFLVFLEMLLNIIYFSSTILLCFYIVGNIIISYLPLKQFLISDDIGLRKCMF